MRKDRQREKDTHFLLSRVPNLGRLIATGETAARVADALEEFHGALHGKLRLARLDLWKDVQRDGELRISVKTREIRRNNKLEEYFQDSEAEVVAYRLDGYEVLNPDLRMGIAPLKNALRKLMNSGNIPTQSIKWMTPNVIRRREKLVTRLRLCVQPLAISRAGKNS